MGDKSTMVDSNQAKICIPVCAQSLDEFRGQATSASSSADLVELRLDCLDSADVSTVKLHQLLSVVSGETIVTFRSPEQGGHRHLTREERREFWLANIGVSREQFCDIELDLVEELSRNNAFEANWSNVICSYHDFERVPADIESIYLRMAKTPARVIKLAVKADDATDCLLLFQLLERARREGREMIAIAMGAEGLATRILGPARGGFLTYGALDGKTATAPGQITASELESLYRIRQIDDQTNVYGVLGLPAGHSVSPQIHNAAFHSLGYNGVYVPFEVRAVEPFLRRMVHPRTREIDWRLQGLSVTAPHKSTVMNGLDWIDPIATEIGAVNTVVVAGDQLHGYNTDAKGFIDPLHRSFGKLQGSNIAVLGGGGAARAVVWALKRENADITIVARDVAKATELADNFEVSFAKLDESFVADYDIVVNATPVGGRGAGSNRSPLESRQLRASSLVYDLISNPVETVLLQEAKRLGCVTVSGIEMLLTQAALQFELWTGGQAPLDVMRTAVIPG